MDGDDGNPLGDFLRARREQLTPELAGVPDYGRRRVPGLRREEIAHLAGVSATYYTRLEQGRDRRPSPEVLDAIARALQLDEHATRHLHTLATPISSSSSGATTHPPERVRDELHRLLDRHVDVPAWVLGRHLDILAANHLARALHVSYQPGRNILRDALLDEEARASYRPADLERDIAIGVALLRTAAADGHDDPRLVALVGELSIASETFRTLWARHDVHVKPAGGVKHFRHPLVGEITLDYESFVIGASDRQQLVVCHARPGSASEGALALLVRPS